MDETELARIIPKWSLWVAERLINLRQVLHSWGIRITPMERTILWTIGRFLASGKVGPLVVRISFSVLVGATILNAAGYSTERWILAGVLFSMAGFYVTRSDYRTLLRFSEKRFDLKKSFRRFPYDIAVDDLQALLADLRGVYAGVTVAPRYRGGENKGEPPRLEGTRIAWPNHRRKRLSGVVFSWPRQPSPHAKRFSVEYFRTRSNAEAGRSLLASHLSEQEFHQLEAILRQWEESVVPSGELIKGLGVAPVVLALLCPLLFFAGPIGPYWWDIFSLLAEPHNLRTFLGQFGQKITLLSAVIIILGSTIVVLKGYFWPAGTFRFGTEARASDGRSWAIGVVCGVIATVLVHQAGGLFHPLWNFLCSPIADNQPRWIYELVHKPFARSNLCLDNSASDPHVWTQE